jgi:hypothetical protein
MPIKSSEKRLMVLDRILQTEKEKGQLDLFVREAKDTNEYYTLAKAMIQHLNKMHYLMVRSKALRGTMMEHRHQRMMDYIFDSFEFASFYWATAAYLVSRALADYKDKDVAYFHAKADFGYYGGVSESPTSQQFYDLLVDTHDEGRLLLRIFDLLIKANPPAASILEDYDRTMLTAKSDTKLLFIHAIETH